MSVTRERSQDVPPVRSGETLPFRDLVDLRIAAFKQFETWGTTDADGNRKPLTPSVIRQEAETLIQWATGSPSHSVCAFCSKHKSEVRKLIAGPSVCICDECVKLCMEIVAEIEQEASLTAPAADTGGLS